MATLVCIGDSVHWGQGMLLDDKFSTQVAAALNLTPVVLAHSGAIIGVGDDFQGDTNSEVPFHYPTIVQQAAAYDGNLNDVSIVLVNGGINDVSVETILDPRTSTGDLTQKTNQFCLDQMIELLVMISRKFTNVNTRIVVTSYFPIFSTQSDFSQVFAYLVARGFVFPSVPLTRQLQELFTIPSIQNSLTFWSVSTAALGAAVQNANAHLGSNRIRFADVPFSETNSMFTKDHWLFNVKFDPSAPFVLIRPTDDVEAARLVACEKHYSGDNLNARVCWLASAGHPNPAGARQYTDAILTAVK